MTSFFWFAQTMNFIITVIALASLMLVIWLNPRGWVNQSYALFALAMILWMAPSLIARLLVNLPMVDSPIQIWLNLLAFGFAVAGLALFWFIESFYPLPPRWFWGLNVFAAFGYGAFIVVLLQNNIIINPHRGDDGGLEFVITPTGNVLSAFHYVFDVIVVGLLVKHRAWRTRWSLTVGALLMVLTSVLALIVPAISVQTLLLSLGILLMTYEVLKQQLFNPLLTMNQRLEAEVLARTQELQQTLAEQERVRSELAVAHMIQQRLLPAEMPLLDGMQLAARSMPAQEVGGDYFTFHQYNRTKAVIAVGDVSGKGVPAALLMALTLRTFEMLVEQHEDQGTLLMELDRALMPRLSQYQMNTALLSVLVDRRKQRMFVANAGLVAPLLWRNGTVQTIESYGLPIGTQLPANYNQTVVSIQAGDRILLASDGLVEAMNSDHVLWGFERLESAFRAIGAASASTIVDTMIQAVETWTGDIIPNDDRTVVVIAIA